MSSQSSSFSDAFSASVNSLPSGPAGSGSGSSRIPGNGGGMGSIRSSHGENDEQYRRQLDRRRATSIAMERKRRLTGGLDDASRRRSLTVSGSDPGSSSRVDLQHRPLPPPPPQTGEEDAAPGSSRATAIDILSSPDASSRQTNGAWPRTRRENDYMDYILPRWQPDDEVDNCPICGTHFSFWYRKHHCRKCGRVVCAACSPHRITIPRQFIVRPPDPNRRPASMFIPPSAAFSQVADLTGDGAQQSTPSGEDQLAFNPALGGGDEVRLCNPCVPDPNPDPPPGYGAVRSGSTASQPLHRPHHSMSAAADRDARRRRYGMLSQSEESGTSGLASYGGLGYRASSYSDNHDSSPPAYASPRTFTGQASQFLGSFGSRPSPMHHRDSSRDDIASSSSTGLRPRQSSRPHRPRVDERDICPICNHILPPRGPDASEEAREAHIRACIEGHGRSSPHSGSPSSQPPHPMRMLAFTATEKDCVGHDGMPQECTICMEEYEVGQQLARLECLCKFHKSCIVEWFGRKKECPVHKAG
ncbi:putative E3 ubiquitin-protein ligase PIB1 [Paecilomyces variotii]|uniref:RING-type E3 ubiquitin transferase n=1 Tax=Byssochlamys spectabilis TaxID=264951 RepID=A0A443HMJ6_BYSSP|nr:putative E3 ubiquitin-protein ligase PIB1 [Paecilomyces variotii]KAJ9353610.1 hypothetical protein DTO280E4_7203 [Paecilomyces variotii]KAJ9393041.1 hypothetical protein DTO063F5_178 [Paecilomyces variotii]RWQ93032.1 putative E3 ubiquitin-protein ligase PIB1 [Paecilomyces variotii]